MDHRLRIELAAPLAAALAALSLAACATAQLRHPCIGRVVDADDAPIAAAEVTLVWVPGPRPGQLDVVRCATDKRGYFRADLVVGHAYSAWALAPAAADGTRLASEVVDTAAAGTKVELAALFRSAPRPLRCVGIEPWQLGQPSRLAFGLGIGIDQELRPERDGTVLLPAGPRTLAALALQTANGERAGSARIDPVDPLPVATFAPPLERRVAVTNADGKPIECAEVEQYAAGTWRRAGITGQDGTCLARLVGEAATTERYWLRIRSGAALVHAQQRYEPADAVVSFRVAAAGRTQARLRGAGDDEIVHGVLRGSLRVENTTREEVWPVEVDGATLRIDALPTPVQEHQYLFALLPRREGTARFALLAKTRDVLDVLPDADLEPLHSIRLRAVDTDNNPVPGARVAVVATTENRNFGIAPAPTWLALDHAGRLDLLLDGTGWAFYVTTGTQQAMATFAELTAAPTTPLRLEPIPTLRLRVTDAGGRPLRGARIEREPGTIGGATIDARGPLAVLRQQIAARVADQTAGAARSDRDGLLVVPVQDWLPLQRTVCVRAGALRSAPFELRLCDEIVEVRMPPQ